MDQLFDATRSELESSTSILNITLDESLLLCKGGKFAVALDNTTIFSGLFGRLARCIRNVLGAIRDHGTRFGTLPNVTPLSPSNFRGATAHKISLMNSLLAKVVFRERTRFFHKLESIDEIVDSLQTESDALISGMSLDDVRSQQRAWQQLEVLGYDLNTCMGETTVILKSFFCALPLEELDSFREKLEKLVPSLFVAGPGETQSWDVS